VLLTVKAMLLAGEMLPAASRARAVIVWTPSTYSDVSSTNCQAVVPSALVNGAESTCTSTPATPTLSDAVPAILTRPAADDPVTGSTMATVGAAVSGQGPLRGLQGFGGFPAACDRDAGVFDHWPAA
jgi:hypothetical protein